MHAMGPNVAGVVGTAVATGVFITLLRCFTNDAICEPGFPIRVSRVLRDRFELTLRDLVGI